MGRIKELINIFLEPKEIEGDFNELAVASGLSTEAIQELNNTKNGINCAEFFKENKDENKEEKTSIKTSIKNINKAEPNYEPRGNKQHNKDIEQEK